MCGAAGLLDNFLAANDVNTFGKSLPLGQANTLQVVDALCGLGSRKVDGLDAVDDIAAQGQLVGSLLSGGGDGIEIEISAVGTHGCAARGCEVHLSVAHDAHGRLNAGGEQGAYQSVLRGGLNHVFNGQAVFVFHGIDVHLAHAFVGYEDERCAGRNGFVVVDDGKLQGIIFDAEHFVVRAFGARGAHVEGYGDNVYAAVDIPECEGFGLSDFGILGLRKDAGFTKKNDSDISMLKYASSAAHISGKKFTSSETFTWLTEHFRTSLSQCKPDLDLMFLSGVNHIFFHGSCYSPKDAEWPGWRFYASVDMTPYNNWWTAMPAFSRYIQRCQSFLQWGDPDNDVLVYLPYYDMLYDQPGTVALFDIHSMEKRAPKFIETVQTIIKSGYDVDYVSDRYLLSDEVTRRYATIIVPDVRFMPAATLRRLLSIAEQGGQVMFVRSFPVSVPGYGKAVEQQEFLTLIQELQSKASFHPEQAMSIRWGQGSIVTSPDYAAGLQFSSARREPMRTEQGLSCIRRSNPEGYHYFVSNLQGRDIDTYVTLGVKAKQVVFYNPMNGQIDLAKTDAQGRVRLQLKSGESVILRTFTEGTSAQLKPHKYLNPKNESAMQLVDWTLSFKESAPVKITQTYSVKGSPKPWTELGDSVLNATMATGVYKTTFNFPKKQPNTAYVLDLGDVRETAHVLVNGTDAGILFAVPFRLDITDYLVDGKNTLEVAVANLPANRIAQLDRDGVEWRKFKEINVVDLNYKNTLYDKWKPVPSGLNSPVRIIPCKVE